MAVGAALVEWEEPRITLICKLREKNVERDSQYNVETSLFISKMTTSWNKQQNLITIVVHQDYQPQPLCLFTASSSFFYSFNFSCCKAHDFCERNLVKPEKCGGNLNYIDQRFEYDTATDTCSKYDQYFLCIISSLSFVVVCIILPKSLASTFPHSPIHTEIYTVKNYCACLWLDERCIFTVVRFQSFKGVG